MEKGNKIANFIKYNNTVPIVLGILFFSTTGALAASPAVRDSIYKVDTGVVSVDTSFLVSADIDSYPFTFRVTKVSEDTDAYYVDYEFHTIDVADAVWRDVSRESTLTVAKAALGSGDLKAYAESQFANLKWHEKDRLTETQMKARKAGASPKVVATAYSGLIGKMLHPDTETFPSYMPPPAEQDPDSPLAVANPVPLVTWDENAGGSAAPAAGPHVVGHTTSILIINSDGSTSTPSGTDGDTGSSTPPTGSTTPPADACPDLEGMQADASECAPPVEEPPPAEAPPPAEEPAPEPEPTPPPEMPAL